MSRSTGVVSHVYEEIKGVGGFMDYCLFATPQHSSLGFAADTFGSTGIVRLSSTNGHASAHNDPREVFRRQWLFSVWAAGSSFG